MTVKKMTAAFFMCWSLAFLTVPVNADDSTVEFKDMHYLEASDMEIIGYEITDSYGKTYEDNIVCLDAGQEAYAVYDLNGQYSSFNASIVCSTETGSDAEMYVGIFADGELVYSLSAYTRQQPVQEINLDVSGVGTLAVKTANTGGWDAYVYFVNSVFTKSASVTDYPDRRSLNDTFVIDSSDCEISDRLFVDAFGNVHNEYIKLNGNDEDYILHNLDKKYETLSGCFVVGQDTGSNASINVDMYLDDTLIYSQENITRQTAQIDFELDVSDGSILKIMTSDKNGEYYAKLFVADTVLEAAGNATGN